MALTQAQIQAILSGINPADMDGFASNPNSVISTMTAEEFKKGLECGTLSLEDLNYLFLYGFLATQKSLEVSKKYTDSQISERANFCNALSSRSGNLLVLDEEEDGCKLYYGIEAPADTANLYFHPTAGKNSNAGTKASPLKTMDEGFRRNNTGTSWTAWLAEGVEHEMRSSWGRWIGQSVTMRPYGNNYDSVVVNNPPSTRDWARCAELTGATVKWISDTVDTAGRESPLCLVASGNTPTYTVTSFGITHDTTDAAGYPVVNVNNSFIGGSNLFLQIDGGGVKCGNSFYFANAYLSNITIVVLHAKVNTTNGNNFVQLEPAANSSNILQFGTYGDVIPNSNGVLTWAESSTKAEWLACIEGKTGFITGNLITN